MSAGVSGTLWSMTELAEMVDGSLQSSAPAGLTKRLRFQTEILPGRLERPARLAPADSGRRQRSTTTPIARPARTSVIQCASKTIRVAADDHASGADFGDARRRRSDRADMHGMAGGKASYSLPERGMPWRRPWIMHRSGRSWAISRFRRCAGRSRDHTEHQVIGLLTLTPVACPRSQPKVR